MLARLEGSEHQEESGIHQTFSSDILPPLAQIIIATCAACSFESAMILAGSQNDPTMERVPSLTNRRDLRALRALVGNFLLTPERSHLRRGARFFLSREGCVEVPDEHHGPGHAQKRGVVEEPDSGAKARRDETAEPEDSDGVQTDTVMTDQ